MSNVAILCMRRDGNIASHVSPRGLSGISRYDPHSPRCFQGIKLNLLENRPTLLRVHSAASYPAGDYRFQLDEEGHAIVIVGYDDVRQAFAVIDPFKRDNLEAAVTWLSYRDLSLTMVDASLGTDLTAPGLYLSATVSEVGHKLFVSVGLPQVYGTIIDHDNFSLEDVRISVSFSIGGKRFESSHFANGNYFIGSRVNFYIDLPIDCNDGIDVEIVADGVLHGLRPYEYRDAIGADFHAFFPGEEMIVKARHENMLFG